MKTDCLTWLQWTLMYIYLWIQTRLSDYTHISYTNWLARWGQRLIIILVKGSTVSCVNSIYSSSPLELLSEYLRIITQEKQFFNSPTIPHNLLYIHPIPYTAKCHTSTPSVLQNYHSNALIKVVVYRLLLTIRQTPESISCLHLHK